MIDLSGRVVLVPGAGGGIGREVARLFAECGSDVALTYHGNDAEARTVHQYVTSLGRRARIDCLDVADRNAVKLWVDEVMATFGQIDVLASCVGWRSEGGFVLFSDQPPEVWQPLISVQMMGFINLAHGVVPHMISQKAGRILQIGSDGGKVGQSGAAVASAAHGGMIAFAKALAREVGRFGVTANVVCPGPTEGPTLERLRSRGTVGSKIVEELIRRVPLKRPGTGREVAAMMAFLASDLGAYITGQAISVSGGLTMS